MRLGRWSDDISLLDITPQNMKKTFGIGQFIYMWPRPGIVQLRD
jgi:hypothetical protein